MKPMMKKMMRSKIIVMSLLPVLGAGSSPRVRRLACGSDVKRAAISVEHRLIHYFGQRRMWEDGRNQLGLGGFQPFGDGEALNELGDLGPDHVRAEKLSALGIEDGLDQPLGLAEDDGLAVGGIREAADLHGSTFRARRLLGHADARNLRRAIGAGRDGALVERVNAF